MSEFPVKGEIPEKLKEKGGKVLVSQWGRTFGVYSKKAELGNIAVAAGNDGVFSEFLNKFGRRLFLDDGVDNLFGKKYRRWKIDFHVLLAGYRLIKENPKGFEKLVKKAKNEKSFLAAAGLS